VALGLRLHAAGLKALFFFFFFPSAPSSTPAFLCAAELRGLGWVGAHQEVGGHRGADEGGAGHQQVAVCPRGRHQRAVQRGRPHPLPQPQDHDAHERQPGGNAKTLMFVNVSRLTAALTRPGPPLSTLPPPPSYRPSHCTASACTETGTVRARALPTQVLIKVVVNLKLLKELVSSALSASLQVRRTGEGHQERGIEERGPRPDPEAQGARPLLAQRGGEGGGRVLLRWPWQRTWRTFRTSAHRRCGTPPRTVLSSAVTENFAFRRLDCCLMCRRLLGSRNITGHPTHAWNPGGRGQRAEASGGLCCDGAFGSTVQYINSLESTVLFCNAGTCTWS